MPYSVWMGADGILRAEISGSFGPGIVTALQRDLSLFVNAATPERPLSGILYTQELDQVSPTLRACLTELHCDPRVGRIAMVNPSREARVLCRFIAHAAGAERTGTFPTDTAAIGWLKERTG